MQRINSAFSRHACRREPTMNTPRGLFHVHVSRKDSAIEADRPSITLLYSDYVMPKGLARWRSGHRGMEAVPASKPNSSLLALAFQHSFSTMGPHSSAERCGTSPKANLSSESPCCDCHNLNLEGQKAHSSCLPTLLLGIDSMIQRTRHLWNVYSPGSASASLEPSNLSEGLARPS